MVFLTKQLAKKVPELTIYFWVIKVLTTGMGEATSDFFVHRYNPYLVVALGAAALAVSLIWQLYVRQYEPWVYWLSVSMVAVFGTMAAGILHVYLGVPYIFSATIYALALTVIFVLWYLVEKTLSVQNIFPPPPQLFFRGGVLAPFWVGKGGG